jgi:DNA-directed RNA polymerase specialized sigma24 family protein
VFYKSEYRSVVALAAVLSGSRWAAQDLAQGVFVAADLGIRRPINHGHPLLVAE